MYETTIKKIMNYDSKIKKEFLNVFARDELPSSIPKLPACFIFNTKNRSNPGQHWLAVYIDKNNHAEFFDSYGYSPAKYRLKTYLKRIASSTSYNKQRIQGQSDFCGLYSILYLLFKSYKQENKFFTKFNNNYNENDKKILFYIKTVLDNIKNKKN